MVAAKLYVGPKGTVFCGDGMCVQRVKTHLGADEVEAAELVTPKMEEEWFLALGSRVRCSKCGKTSP